MKIVIISDVHCKFNNLKIESCDILISCGDYSFHGRPEEVRKFHKWLDEQDAKYIISVQGNHEMGVERNFQLSKEIAEEVCPDIHFIDEGLVEIEGLKIWCSAITPFFYNWAWNRFRGEEIKKHWDKIPLDIDVLVTHGPPHGILDGVERFNGKTCLYELEHVGCEELYKKIQDLKNLKVHAFGHIHCGNGSLKVGDTNFINASICNEKYEPVNKPYIIVI